MQWPLPLGLW